MTKHIKENHTDSYKIDMKEQIFYNIKLYPPLNIKETIKLFELVNQGSEEAKNKLLLHNQGLIVHALKFINHNPSDFCELFQEGIIALERAITTFDFNKGYKFSTYAVTVIKNHVDIYNADKIAFIKIPHNVVTTQKAIKKAYKELTDMLGRNPNYQELAEYTKINMETIVRCFAYQEFNPISLNEIITLYEDKELISILPLHEQTIEEKHILSDLKITLKEFIESLNLTQREFVILEKRLGYNNTKTINLEELSKLLKVSKGRAQQLDVKLLKKLFDSEKIWELAELTRYPHETCKIIKEYKETKKLPKVNRMILIREKDGK